MVKSLEILQNMPGHEERKEACASLTEQLLSVVRPRVRAEIGGTELTSLHEYLYVYGKLGRFVYVYKYI